MAELAREPAPYRPVSGFAIAGLMVSALFAVWVSVATLVAFRTGAPFLMNPGGLLLPLAGFGLSMAARVQIRRSEGTRAGLPLTTWGIYLSVLFGLGYAAYRGATEYALRLQAKEFADAWFDQLLQPAGEDVHLATAFQETLPPGQRDPRLDRTHPKFQPNKPYSPELTAAMAAARQRHLWDEKLQKGLYPRFLDHDLIEVLRQGGAQAKVESQGVRRWEYLGGSVPAYLVEQTYLVTTPAGEHTVVVTALGSDDAESGRRIWRVLLDETGVNARNLSPIGMAAAALRNDSRQFAGEWLRRLTAGSLEEAYLDTVDFKQRDRLRQAYEGGLMLSALSPSGGNLMGALTAYAGLGKTDVLRLPLQPGFAKFTTADLVQGANLEATSGKARAIQAVKALFQRTTPQPQVAAGLADGRHSTRWRLEPELGVAVFFQPFELRLAHDLRCEGTLVLQTESPAALAALQGATGAELRLVGAGRNVTWRVVGMNLETAGTPPRGPGAPPTDE